ncbi:MAG TPA: ABC transporter permease [Stellaceae bacterium]|nr:ABC transporter permease [Stellaceae bacterium]
MVDARLAGPAAARSWSPVLPLRVATMLALLVIWEAVARSGLVFEGVVPSLVAIGGALADLLTSANFYWNLELTAIEVAVSLALGASAGIVVGLVLGARPFAGKAFEPYVHYLAPTPKIVFLPILLVLFGVGPGSKIAMGALSCFFPMVLSVASGVRQVDPVLLRVGRSFNLSILQTVRKIYLPALVAPIATGLRLGSGVAIIGCLLAEIKMSNRGLGFLVMQYYSQFRIPYMYAALLVAFIIAAGGNAVIARYLRLPGK